MLYPLKFKPIFKERIWGGDNLKRKFNKKTGKIKNCGESWELSGVQDSISVVSNGFLKGNNLQDLIEVYMGDLVGEKIFEKFGIEFPLLLKFIDAKDVLSLQVHPNDELAAKRHNAYGKTELWYIIEAENNAEIITGFNHDITKEEYQAHLQNNTIRDLLNVETAYPGDVFFLPAGRIHAIGSGILLAEIQQTSDITYRIYDWDRKDEKGKARELHTELALDAIDYHAYPQYKTLYKSEPDQTTNIVACRYFTVNLVNLNQIVSKNFHNFDSFVIYMCVQGECKFIYDNQEAETIKAGECILIPAIIKEIVIEPEKESKMLEIFIA